MRWLLCVIVCGVTVATHALDLAYFEKLAQEMPELVKPDNADPLWPDFKSFYQHMALPWYTRWWRGIRGTFGFREQDIFEEFPSLMLRAADAVHAANVQVRDGLLRFEPVPGTRLIIIGEASGAFHSLVRDLRECVHCGLIDKNLKLAKNSYLVFLANTFGRSAYGVQTLALIAQLLINNQTRAFYLTGSQEADYVHESIVDQIGYFWPKTAAAVNKNVQSFFAEIPRAVILGYTDELRQSKKVYFSYAGAPHAPYSQDPRSDFDYFPQVTTQIRCEEFNIFFRPVSGVEMMMPQEGIVTWSVFSGPTLFGREVRQFFNDAFAVVHVNQPSRHWTIESHTRDTRDKKAFMVQTYDFMTGQVLNAKQANGLANAPAAYMQPPAAGRVSLDHGNEYDFVFLCDLTNTAAVYSLCARAGMYVRWLDEMREHGGVAGKFLRWIVLDNEYVPAIAAAWAKRMLDRYKTDVATTLGSPPTQAVLPFVKDGKILLLFPCIGTDFLYDPSLKYVVNLRQSYGAEVRVLVHYAVDDLHSHKIAIFYQDDAYGEPQKNLAMELLKNNPSVQVLLLPHTRNAPNFDRFLKEILAFDPDTFLLFAVDPNIEELVRILGVGFLANRVLLTNSVGSDNLRAHLRRRGLDAAVTRVMPLPVLQSFELARQFRKCHSLYVNDETFDEWSLEGYVVMSLFIDALKNIPQPITKEKIIAYVENLHNVDYFGIPLDFNREKRRLLDGLWLVLNNGERVMIREKDLGHLSQ